MSLTYGFYNSMHGDRRYDAVQMSSIFDGIITDGIFETIGDKFTVTEQSGMNVVVGTGRAWFNRTWTLNDSPLVVKIYDAEVVLDRIDTIVIDVDKPSRVNSIIVVKGTPASSPIPPTLINDSDAEHYQYPLCNIYVRAGVTEIYQPNITPLVGVTTPIATAATVNSTIEHKLDLAGGTMTGPIDMGKNPIDNVPTPTTQYQAANKDYVDTNVINKTKLKPLWTNASPGSSFPAQSISISKFNTYSELLITFRESTTFGYEKTIVLPYKSGYNNNSVCSFSPYIADNGHYLQHTYSRFVVQEYDGKLTFLSGFSTQNNTSTDSVCYPVRIWGRN